MSSAHSNISPSTVKMTVHGLVQLMRPRQWIKSAFVCAPLVFSGSFLDGEAIKQVLLAMFLFSVAASATYIVNDIHDREDDKKHPQKAKSRPLASGLLTIPQALGLLVVLYAILLWGYFQTPMVTYIIAGYLLLNIAYTFFLKYQPVVDIFTIAIGFVLRVYAGGMAINMPVSSWMFVTTLCLALYLAAIKRRQEIISSGTQGRGVLARYTVRLIDRYAEMAGVGALVFYGLFVMSSRPEMVITIPLVLYGLFRYWYVVEVLDGGESPTDVLLQDWQLMLTIVAWISLCVYLLWPQ